MRRLHRQGIGTVLATGAGALTKDPLRGRHRSPAEGSMFIAVRGLALTPASGSAKCARNRIPDSNGAIPSACSIEQTA
jgi:hypothetical protein